MSIREYCESDFLAVVDIYAGAKLDELKFEAAEFNLLPLDQDAERLAKLKESDIYLYQGQAVLGYAAHCGSEICSLFVSANARGQGIGIKLLEFLLSKIQGPASLHVACLNFPAINLYRKYGFEVIEEFATSYNNTQVMAAKMMQLA